MSGDRCTSACLGVWMPQTFSAMLNVCNSVSVVALREAGDRERSEFPKPAPGRLYTLRTVLNEATPACSIEGKCG